MRAQDLLAKGLSAPHDSAERILYVAAAFCLAVGRRMVLVGGGAQVTHTGTGRLTDIDLVGPLSPKDHEALVRAGFKREGRHWVYEADGDLAAVEVPAEALIGDEPPELVDVDGVVVPIIALNDLVMDRLIQATDGTPVTWDELVLLTTAAGHRIGWDSIERRCVAVARTEPFLRSLPELVERVRFDS